MTPLEAARSYRALGWSVIPVAGDKRPTIEWGPYLLTHATDDRIRRWWGPAPGVAIVCGRVSRLVVLDIDPRNGGMESTRALLSPFIGQVSPTFQGAA